LSFAFSPCPNDTFMFHGLASGSVAVPGCRLETHLRDVEALNGAALAGRYDVTKLSFHAWLLVRDRYRLLDAGAALGYGCGPLVVSREPMDRGGVSNGRVAVPGERTTAHLLFRLWAPDAADRVFARYDRIIPMVSRGDAGAGVIIHEGRFVFREAGLHAVADLGQWWEHETGLPIPLGCIAVRETLGEDTIAGVEKAVRRSIRAAQAHPERTHDYVLKHAAEMNRDVLERHIATFVNDFSLGLGETGRRAVSKLEERAAAAGVTE